MYLTYDEYLEFGGTIDEAAFSRYEFEAESLIDWYTFNRLQADLKYSHEVKMCTYMLIVLISEKYTTLTPSSDGDGENAVPKSIASQSNDGVSISYNTLSSYNLLTTCKEEIVNTINLCLRNAVNKLGRKLLYRGLYPGE